MAHPGHVYIEATPVVRMTKLVYASTEMGNNVCTMQLGIENYCDQVTTISYDKRPIIH